jgi:3',5'-cyclic AMP phosphodiesterase CpdA
MSEFRVSQISDTHLARCLGKVTENFQRVSERINATRPDIIINTGDLAFDAPTNRDDLVFAKGLHNDLPVACRYLPGNHDIGDNPTVFGPPSEQAVTEESRRYFISVVGADRWSFDAAGWRFIGLNSMVMNSGLPYEGEQFDWLTSQLATAGSKPVALFLHKPLYLNTAADPESVATSSLYVPQPARRRLIELLDAVDLRLVASGHIHQHRDFARGRIRHVWSPPTGFIFHDAKQERIGIKEVGLVEYRFEPHGFDARYVRARGQINIKSLSVSVWAAYQARKISSYLRRTNQPEKAH